jgi:hypothetical protein
MLGLYNIKTAPSAAKAAISFRRLGKNSVVKTTLPSLLTVQF